MNFLTRPNLPDKRVKTVIVDTRAKRVIKELNNLGIKVIETKTLNCIETPIATHPDMQICHIGTNTFYFMEEVADYYIKQIPNIDCEIINNLYENGTRSTEVLAYPQDCKLNAAISDEWVITHINNDLFDSLNKRVIKTKQGYAKCSIGIVSDNAIITADKSIEKFAALHGIDVCIVTNDCIRLDGYKNGFIGGCCGKISKDTLAFCGNIKLHPDYDKIKSFCNNYGVMCLELSNEELTDYGSILPIMEQ